MKSYKIIFTFYIEKMIKKTEFRNFLVKISVKTGLTYFSSKCISYQHFLSELKKITSLTFFYKKLV